MDIQHDQDDHESSSHVEKEAETFRAVVRPRSPSNATILQAGLKGNLSSSEAKAQLRVLCRKFATLTEKVKEETKVREAAEREVRRLKALVDTNASPASCRTETQTYVRELKETQERLKRELRLEKEKNERIVAKALELEREKSAHFAAQPPQQVATNKELSTTCQSNASSSSLNHQSAWDKEQMFKIQSTLKLTIEELEDELSRKEQEVQTYREQSQRDRARIKDLEDDIRTKDDAQRAVQEARRQLEADIRQAQTDITNELESVQRIHDQAQEDRVLRDTLERQLVTLGEVNAALEQRSRALVRRLELASAATHECQDLKLQLQDTEVKNETLVQTIRNLKEEHFGREKEWEHRLENAKEEKTRIEQQVLELQEDLVSLQAQNSLFSEWMFVRNENAIAAQRGSLQDQEYQQMQQTKPRAASFTDKHSRTWHEEQEYDPGCHGNNNHANRAVDRSAPTRKNLRQEHDDESRYMHFEANIRSPPESPPLSRQRRWQSTASSNPRKAALHGNLERVNPLPRSPHERMRWKTSTRSMSSVCSSAPGVEVSSPSSPVVQDDHERLRALMSRNRELQQRLEQETMATQNLEREITNMTS